jgi:uncharacterized cofD-like protein
MSMRSLEPSTPPPTALSFPGQLRVAALGGGTGLPNVLRGLCSLLYGGTGRGDVGFRGDQLVAIVTTTDDGGSSGRLRREFGVIPPGDIRNCLAAMAEDQSLITAVFQFRFESGDGLNGHALGNLMLTALTEVTGDFTRAVEIAGRVVGARGRVVPATIEPVTLTAELNDGRTAVGETAIVSAGCGIRRLSLSPAAPRGVDAALDALRRADVIVAGPGSLFTSILPPLLIPEILEAIRLADASRVFVMNLMTEPGETAEFEAAQHLEVVRDHLGFQPSRRQLRGERFPANRGRRRRHRRAPRPRGRGVWRTTRVRGASGQSPASPRAARGSDRRVCADRAANRGGETRIDRCTNASTTFGSAPSPSVRIPSIYI